jgi:hypothetical protein
MIFLGVRYISFKCMKMKMKLKANHPNVAIINRFCVSFRDAAILCVKCVCTLFFSPKL